jgi:D-ribose pyranose/furanose isomerase RbsD
VSEANKIDTPSLVEELKIRLRNLNEELIRQAEERERREQQLKQELITVEENFQHNRTLHVNGMATLGNLIKYLEEGGQ